MSLLWLSLGLDNNQWGHERGLCGAGIVCLLIFGACCTGRWNHSENLSNCTIKNGALFCIQ